MRSWLITLVFGGAVLGAAAEVERHEGDIGGAPYTVLVPSDWKAGKVFMPVHGWRPPEAPHLADLDPKFPLYAKLLDAGWIVAKTGFLENGVDHDAHTKALWDLRKWIETEVGAIETMVLEGESTAGTLVLRIAEQDSGLADGVIALGPFVELEDETDQYFLQATPKLPSILMTNMTEITDDLAYAAVAAEAEFPPALRPLRRPGHMNMNWVERWAAFEAMAAALAEGEAPELTDGTRAMPARETGTQSDAEGLSNQVVDVHLFFGNAVLGFHPDELAEAGIEQGDMIEITTAGETWSLLYGVTYGDVEQGEWIAFPTADENVLLVRNHESAIATAGLKIGDVVQIRPTSPTEER